MAREDPPSPGLFDRLKVGLERTRRGLMAKIGQLVAGARLDPAALEAIEELLLAADVGISTTERLVAPLRIRLGQGDLADPRGVEAALKAEILAILRAASRSPAPTSGGDRPRVLLFLGVNGSGKTTTIAKLARRLTDEGGKVVLAAADTFRAAAIEQLQAWAARVPCEVIAHQPGADPSAVVFDALQAAIARRASHLLIDTAGRLHTKRNLMEELKKIRRVVARHLPAAPHERLMVLDATSGLNAIAQAREFNEAVDLTGIVLTKLDGTAKGGVVVAIAHELRLPIVYVGVGEGIDDLHPFSAEAYTEALFAPAAPTSDQNSS
jgi:fused signal recognition particle receptor